MIKKQFNQILFLFLVGLFLFAHGISSNGQVKDQSDSIQMIKKHSPRRAVVYSMVCPGLGQIYNKKFWKVPLIYGVGGCFAYYSCYNQLKYTKFRNAYIANESNKNRALIDGKYYDYEILFNGMRYYERLRTLSVAGLGAVYLLQIIDAMVDANFFYYDVSDDLSLRIQPLIIENPGVTAAVGIGVSFEW
jgi:hypothetical protein